MLSEHLGQDENVASTIKRRTIPSPSSHRRAVPGRALTLALLSVFLMVIVITLTACGTVATEAPPPPTTVPPTPTTVLPTPTTAPPLIGTLMLSESGCSLEKFEGSFSVGFLAIDVVNETAVNSFFDLWKLDEGYTYEQLAEHIKEERRLAESGQPRIGHPSQVGDLSRFSTAAGESFTFSNNFSSPGTYAIVCFQLGNPSFIELVGPFEVE